MTFKLSKLSQRRLVGVHPNLVRVVSLAITFTPIDFSVVEGLRTLNRQKYLYRIGKSRTMNSRHLIGHAVDLGPWVGGKILWDDGPHWMELSQAVKRAASMCSVNIQWGFDLWGWDKPHWQIVFIPAPNHSPDTAPTDR